MKDNLETKNAAFQYGVETELPDFQQYFADKISVVGFPVLKEFENKYSGFEVVINVCDECYVSYANALMKKGIQHYWFPMGESGKDMGLNSAFGALYILYQCYLENKNVLLHCHAGANRSPTINSMFYFMMQGKHKDEIRDNNGHIWNGNMLLHNAGKHLPALEWIEKWLTKCKHAFDHPNQFIGGMFDWTIDDKRDI